MSNPSLKEQLQALSIETRSGVRDNKKVQQKPAWLEYAQYGVELLKAHYPACFKENKDIRPLKIGIKQDLIKHLSAREDVVVGDKACMVSSLAYYVNSTAYYKNIVMGAERIDLEGNSAGLVTLEEANYSLERCQAKLQKKKGSKPKVKSHSPISQES